MKTRYGIYAVAILAVSALPAFAAESHFERMLTLNGRATLNVGTGSGNIHLHAGAGNQIHIAARVHSGNSWGLTSSGSPEQHVQYIASHPPIEQTGNIVTIGRDRGEEAFRHVSIDYDIEVPADAFLDAHTGSGDIKDESVGVNPRLHTGSGSIQASGIAGSLEAKTGSGDVDINLGESGDVRAETGSGSIRINNVHGGLSVSTGSGDIRLTGVPTASWHVSTGSGSVELGIGSAPVSIDASTGSGSVHTDQQLTIQGEISKHHVQGKINGGGPTLTVHTGSGDVRIY